MNCTTLPQRKSTRNFLFAGRHDHTIEPKAQELTSFPHFQQYLLDKLGVLANHRSQDSPSVRRRRRDWEIALQAAFDLGAA